MEIESMVAINLQFYFEHFHFSIFQASIIQFGYLPW